MPTDETRILARIGVDNGLMKIVKKGREQKGWAKEFTCTGGGNGGGGCGAVLLVEQDDVFTTESHHYDGSSEYYNTFKCAACGVCTDIKESVPFSPKSRSEALVDSSE